MYLVFQIQELKMGTHSIIRLCKSYDGKKTVIAAIYQQFDGYYSCVGAHLAGFMMNFVIINGISGEEDPNAPHANGAEDLYAMYIAYLKKDPSNIGGIYLTIPNACDEEYSYEIICDENDKLTMTANCDEDEEDGKDPDDDTRERNFTGSPSEFFKIWGSPVYEYKQPLPNNNKRKEPDEVRTLLRKAKKLIERVAKLDNETLDDAIIDSDTTGGKKLRKAYDILKDIL
jgi:hypothetical protein